MRVLLDTHSLLWAVGSPEKLSKKARIAIEESANRIYISMATLWELSIKVNIGKLQLPDLFFEELEPAGFEILALKKEHLAEYRNLSLQEHRDPFDRLLVAQATVEQLILVSRDQELHQYNIPILPA